MSPRSLLLVDADPAVHEFLTSILKREDRQLHQAYDAGEALERLRASPFDLLLAGQGRNGVDELKLLRRALAISPGVKVIVTGDADPARVVDAMRHHAYSYFHKPLPPSPLADMVQQALSAETWKDDIRLISSRPAWISLDVRCKLDAAERATQFLREVEADLPSQKRDDIVSALRELLINAIEHGAKSDPRKRARISLLRTARSLIGQVQDPGAGFSLDLLPHAAISNPDGSPTRHVEIRAEQGQRPGGFGILMARNLVDELLYNERGNAVTFVKYL